MLGQCNLMLDIYYDIVMIAHNIQIVMVIVTSNDKSIDHHGKP